MISIRDKSERSETLATPDNFKGGQLHYLAVKKLPALLRGTTPKHHGDFYCLNSLHSCAQLHKIVCENKDFCNVIMPSEDSKILKFNQYQK